MEQKDIEKHKFKKGQVCRVVATEAQLRKIYADGIVVPKIKYPVYPEGNWIGKDYDGEMCYKVEGLNLPECFLKATK